MISEIRKEAKSYAFRNDGYGYDLNTCEDIFSDGAGYGYQLAVEKACEWWVDELSYPSMTQEELRWCKSKVNAFRRAMKGGEE